jgi:putative PIN family toxin of toxin-antitoxin system
MRVVIDTNVFVSSFFGGNPRRVIDLWKTEKILLCLSKDIFGEYLEVLQRIGFKNEEELEELLSLFARGFNLEFILKTRKIKAVKDDPDDDKFIECAVALHADVIVTGDKVLEKIGEYMNIKIFTPQKFLSFYGK